MLINFCDSRLYPKISCDKVTRDGHEVENLISNDWSQRQRGFLGEHFIRPPVTVTLSFPCNIEIKCIVINPCVSAQRSSGLEIYSRSNQVTSRPGPLWEHVPQIPSKEKNAYEFIASAVFTPIGKVQLSDPGIVYFENRLFQHKSANEKEQIPKSQCQHIIELRGRNLRALNFVSDLNIRVTRTASGQSVAIKNIEVWGQPSKSVPKPLRDKIENLFCESALPNVVDTNIQRSISMTQTADRKSTAEICVQTSNELIHLENGVEVPEDFVDCITCEIMTVPMLLPCGKNIDQSTLERHNSVEASWGRLPSDPFTGVTYNDQNKPLPNTPLKVRLDKFLLENSLQLQHIPKTLGRYSDNCSAYQKNGPNLSRLVESHENISRCRADNIVNDQGESAMNEILQIRKRKKVCLHSDIKDKRNRKTEPSIPGSDASENCHSDLNIIDLTKDDMTSVTMVTGKGQSVSLKTKSHEEELKESIDSAFSAVLSQLPSFTKSERNVEDEAGPSSVVRHSQSHCSNCEGQCGSMYRAPCGHLFCRKCVLKDTNRCSVVLDKMCQKSWKSSEICKVH